MRRLSVLAIFLAAALVFQLVLNCAKPLESDDDGPIKNPRFIFDTVTIVDTLVMIDTVIVVDSVFVVMPDSGARVICSFLEANINELVWSFRNPAGTYKFYFEGYATRNKPPKSLMIEIDGQSFEWKTSESLEFLIEANLSENGIVRISANEPPALGHRIDICLTIGAP